MQPGHSKACPQCHQLAPIDAPYCSHCGHAFRSQFANPPAPGYSQPMQPMHQAYPPQQIIYVPIPVGDPYSHHRPGQTAVKWLIWILVLACLGVGAYLVIRTKLAPPGQQPRAIGAQVIPTSAFNDVAANSSYRISLVWEKKDASSTLARITNEGPSNLPNLFIQVLTPTTGQDGETADQWSEPYQIQFAGPGGVPGDEIPMGKGGVFTLPIPFAKIERLHAYFVQQTPAGAIQQEIGIDQNVG